VDRELIELDTHELCDEERELAGDRVKKRHCADSHEGHRSAL
jgi:hypothetical protein